MMSTTLFDAGIELLVLLLSISLLICFVRLFLGPYTSSRVVAFDLIAIHAVAIIALFAVLSEAPALLDAAIVTAVLGFLGTVMFAHYLERAGSRDSDEPLDR